MWEFFEYNMFQFPLSTLSHFISQHYEKNIISKLDKENVAERVISSTPHGCK